MKYKQNWNLENIFPGGYDSPQANARLKELNQDLGTLATELAALDLAKDVPAYHGLSDYLKHRETDINGLMELNVFWTAHQSADFNNTAIGPKLAQVSEAFSTFKDLEISFGKKLAEINDDDFKTLIALPDFKEIAFNLTEDRKLAAEQLDEKSESIINKLAIDGFTGWSTHYDTIASQISVPYTDDNGKTQTLSAGQALNQLTGAPDNNTRKNIMSAYEKAWGSQEAVVGDTLNHLAGFRLQNYKLHGTDDFLKHPLELNRMSRQTLRAMWNVVEANKGMFIPYMDRKAALLGKQTYDWQDQTAPIMVDGYESKAIDYDHAADFIVANFRKFSPKMADLAQTAFDNQWIEVEDRPGKQPGGYMEEIPERQESRIFLTYTGTPDDASSVAHEIGHAFHYSVVKDLPEMRRSYAMNVAETASTFAELVVADANVKSATSVGEKINLLDTKMNNPVAMFMNIRARYLFETNFYKERLNGQVTPERMDALMLAAQKWAFSNHLGTYHPHFWASKLHFYIDEVPFYNFPYTFGYLFSLGIYAKAQASGGNFEDQYIALLRDTANMSTEDLAKKHLGVDLTKPDFWQSGADLVKKDIDEFLKLSDDLVH
ncbi:M3 family oligoendopeptidase [Furfurilactobacillus rossiae]|nr:M3 family oligoendopeptidase [Furfurilactobacillus rossiae]QFR66809.1 M3 family oligoendopeptidase [Furfurilactobacillus rossiae]QLE62296.1 Oligoendopeptidase F [Furfurilactobacillus rossiae]